MKVEYNDQRDELRIEFSTSEVATTTAVAPGVIAELDGKGAVRGLSIAKASKVTSVTNLDVVGMTVKRKNVSRGYTERSIRLSREIYKFLRGKSKVLKGQWVTYQELGEAIGEYHRTLARPLGVIQDHCRERNWPTITAFVVRKDKGLPSEGCDVSESDDVLKTAIAARAMDWPADPWW